MTRDDPRVSITHATLPARCSKRSTRRNCCCVITSWAVDIHKSSIVRSDYMKLVVIGGTGLIGSKLVALLRQRGKEVRAASPASGVNALRGQGLTQALAGAQV